jgi:hypothetical protein
MRGYARQVTSRGRGQAARADALFELCDAIRCADHAVTSLVQLSLQAEFTRGHDTLAAGLSVCPGREGLPSDIQEDGSLPRVGLDQVKREFAAVALDLLIN